MSVKIRRIISPSQRDSDDGVGCAGAEHDIPNVHLAIVGAGMVVGFKAAEENGHHLINRSDAPAKYLVMSSRMEEDAPIYPDDDVKWFEGENGEGYAAHKDGTQY